MSTEAGASEALWRIRHAAREICGDNDARRSLAEQITLRSCVANTVERTVAASNQPTLIAVSQDRHVAAMASAAR